MTMARKRGFTFPSSIGQIDIDMSAFFKAIGDRPILYDFRPEGRTDGVRGRMHEGWLEVANLVIPNFKDIPDEEQTSIVNNRLKPRWKATKEQIRKAHRLEKSGDPNYKPYAYMEENNFYIKMLNGEDKRAPAVEKPKPPVEVKRNHISLSVLAPMFLDEYDEQVETNNQWGHQNAYTGNGTELATTTYYDETDWAFFESLIPSVCEMDENQKIDFKIELLQIVKKYQTDEI
ncbi:uncharacterized protein LOC142220033 [Haematobia irritans]|uniref:uncharacterized protein LOC142220033 n=1 Tax=Haematobia irritans TaxID=7368 RepID=UPI003F501028